MKPSPSQSIDGYIAAHPPAVQLILSKMRATIHRAAPDATEKISYGIPTFYLDGNLVHFAAFKKHVSFFPTSSGTNQFKVELAAYDGSKGTVRFPLGTPIPYGLITRIVKFRVQENRARAKTKATRKS